MSTCYLSLNLTNRAGEPEILRTRVHSSVASSNIIAFAFPTASEGRSEKEVLQQKTPSSNQSLLTGWENEEGRTSVSPADRCEKWQATPPATHTYISCMRYTIVVNELVERRGKLGPGSSSFPVFPRFSSTVFCARSQALLPCAFQLCRIQMSFRR